MEGSYSGFSMYHNGGPRRENDFEKLAQTIGTNIQKISQNVSSMKKMINQLGTPQDSQVLQNQLYQIQTYTQQFAKDTSASLKELSAITAANPEQREWKAQKDRLVEEFGTALNSFQTSQRDAAYKRKEQIRRVRANSGLSDNFAGGRFSDELIELRDNTSRQAQLQEEMDLQMLEEQEQSVRELESNISDINQIFKELGAIVHEQGEVIDSIEANVEKTEVFVNEGTNQLHQASNYQTKVRRKKCILAVCLAVILSIIIGIIVWQNS